MRHPPPADLGSRVPLVHSVSNAEVWYRSHQIRHSPVHFGKTASSRWDAPKGEFGVLYLGLDPYVAFMESIGRAFLRSRMIPASVLQFKLVPCRGFASEGVNTGRPHILLRSDAYRGESQLDQFRILQNVTTLVKSALRGPALVRRHQLRGPPRSGKSRFRVIRSLSRPT